jgi:hypothetical protein
MTSRPWRGWPRPSCGRWSAQPAAAVRAASSWRTDPAEAAPWSGARLTAPPSVAGPPDGSARGAATRSMVGAARPSPAASDAAPALGAIRTAPESLGATCPTGARGTNRDARSRTGPGPLDGPGSTLLRRCGSGAPGRPRGPETTQRAGLVTGARLTSSDSPLRRIWSDSARRWSLYPVNASS